MRWPPDNHYSAINRTCREERKRTACSDKEVLGKVSLRQEACGGLKCDGEGHGDKQERWTRNLRPPRPPLSNIPRLCPRSAPHLLTGYKPHTPDEAHPVQQPRHVPRPRGSPDAGSCLGRPLALTRETFRLQDVLSVHGFPRLSGRLSVLLHALHRQAFNQGPRGDHARGCRE